MNDTLLMVADSDRDADMLYAVGTAIPNRFIYLQFDGKPHIVMDDVELDRVRGTARHCRLHSLNALLQRLRRDGRKNPRLDDVIALLLKERKVRKVDVPPTFPIGIARELKRHGFKVKPRSGPVFPTREIKSPTEIKKISAAITMAEVGLSEGIQALRNSKIGRTGEIVYRGCALTSERLRSIINTAIIQAGGAPGHTIVAGARQSSDPRETGFGPLAANHPIILEVAPRSQKTGYHGKITRTVVKGRASDAVRAVHHAVAGAQELIFSQLRNGSSARAIQEAVAQFFIDANYQTRRREGRIQGFLHDAGHGIGLEPVEAPFLSADSKDILSVGHIISIRPGLYFNGLGGVRLEDIGHVTNSRPRNLTQFEKQLEV